MTLTKSISASDPVKYLRINAQILREINLRAAHIRNADFVIICAKHHAAFNVQLELRKKWC